MYQSEDGSGLVGAHRTLRVQPANPPEGARDFAFALLVPKESYDAASRARTLRLALPFAIAAGVGVLLSLCLSRLYLRPVLSEPHEYGVYVGAFAHQLAALQDRFYVARAAT